MTTFSFTALAAAASQTFRPEQTPLSADTQSTPDDEAMADLGDEVVSTMAMSLANNEHTLTAPHASEDVNAVISSEPDAHALRNRKLAVLIGSRIVAARELSGLQQLEFSRAIGHKTPAQPSMWESGRRLVPLADVPTVARVLGVSADFLLGLSDEPDRDPAVARRSLLTQHLRDQVEVFAGHMADAALESGVEIEGALRSTKLLSRCHDLQCAVDRFKAANADCFDDLPAGALLLRSVRELAEAVEVVAAELDGVGRRRERAARKAKAVMGV